MVNNKALIVFTAIGPTFRKRVIDNIQNHTALKYFDTLVLTDIVDDFDEVKRYNLFVRDINTLRDDWSKTHEVLPTPTKDVVAYANEMRVTSRRYPYSIQRYSFNLENIENYKGVLLLDCDIHVKYDDTTITKFYNYLDNIKINTVTGHNVYDYTGNDNIKNAVVKYSKLLNLPVSNLDDGYLLNDGPVRIYKFVNKQSIQQFLNVYSFIIKDAFERVDLHLTSGSWNILAEPVLAIIYKLLNIKVVGRSFDYGCDNSTLTCRTFPEDRFWNSFPGWEFNLTANSKEGFVKLNYTLLKNFYEKHNHLVEWPY
jgi:hypothetical protein